MDYSVKLMFRKQFIYKIGIGYICFYKRIIRLILNIRQIFRVSRISQSVQIKNLILRIFRYKQPNHVRTDKSCSSCYEYFFHFFTTNFYECYEFNEYYELTIKQITESTIQQKSTSNPLIYKSYFF